MSEQEPLLPTTTHEVANHEHDEAAKKKQERQERLGEHLESRRFHKLVLTLITIDAICVLADLSYTFLSDSCAPDHEEEPDWLRVFSIISLIITSLFLIEIPLNVYAFGGVFYNPRAGIAKGPLAVHSGLHFLDAVVIIVTFVLEVFLKGRELELASLLILFRLWRLVKLVSGVAIGVGETSEADAKRLIGLDAELKASKAQLDTLKKENETLKERLAALEAGDTEGVDNI